MDHTPPLGHGNHAFLQATFNIWTICRNKFRLNYKKANYSEMRWELDGVQYNSSMSSEQNWEKLKFSLEKAPVIKIKMIRQNNFHSAKKVTAKKAKWKLFTENKTEEN